MRDIQQLPSPNFEERRPPSQKIAYVILHYTGMCSRDEALAKLCDPAAEVSAHYLIDEGGAVFQMVDERYRAWHAGQSLWRGASDLNSASIGIELANPGHEFGYIPFPGAQIESLVELLRDIIMRHDLNPATALLGHSDIAPTRKQDPGELFPWQQLAREGLGIWPEPLPEDFAPAHEGEVQKLLQQIGYDTVSPKLALTAFQRRFQQHYMTGEINAETLAIMRAVARQMSG